jgi:hypothetical protein
MRPLRIEELGRIALACPTPRARRLATALGLLATGLCIAWPASAQPPFGGRGGGAPQSPREAQPFDLTGQWVSIVNEDWRWRMVTPPPGDFPGLPLSQAGRQIANAWDPALDGACEAFGAAGLMRMPTRLRIDWDGDDTLVIETDAGRQTRRLEFSDDAVRREPSLQGISRARWDRPAGGRGLFAPRGAGPGGAPGGHLVVTTDNLLPGWLRRNGVPYSDATVMTEHFDRFAGPNGDEWLMVTTIVDDPVYLSQPYITSTHFRRENDRSGWKPTDCGVAP